MVKGKLFKIPRNAGHVALTYSPAPATMKAEAEQRV